MKRRIMESYGGIFPFRSDLPVIDGKVHKAAQGFWLRDGAGKTAEVSAKVWFGFYSRGLDKVAGTEQAVGPIGGRIVIGLSKVNSEEDLDRVEAYAPSLINKVLTPQLPDSGWTIGRFGHGRYVADDGTIFDERSTVIVIAGITTPVLKNVARLLAREFNQSWVLVFDDNNGKTVLIGQDEPTTPSSGPEFE
jgi:hypothetical protein